MKALLAIAIVTAPAAALAQSNPTPNPDGGVNAAEMRDRTLAEYEVERDSKTVDTARAREALSEFASCVAKKDGAEATRLLTMDFKDAGYRRGLTSLAQDNAEICGNGKMRGSTLRTAGLLFAGSLAEAMVGASDVPVVKRLALAAGQPATTAFSFTDRVAICVVRSVPDQVADLFATPVDSALEAQKLQVIAGPMAMCAKAAEAKKPISVNPAGLRAMLATAAFRTIQNSEASS